jgi:hypothetical protein
MSTRTPTGSHRTVRRWLCTACRSPRAPIERTAQRRRRNGHYGTPRSPKSRPTSNEPDAEGKRWPECWCGGLKMWAHLQRQGIPVARCTGRVGATDASRTCRRSGSPPSKPYLGSVLRLATRIRMLSFPSDAHRSRKHAPDVGTRCDTESLCVGAVVQVPRASSSTPLPNADVG